jgi:hypothetical protein
MTIFAVIQGGAEEMSGRILASVINIEVFEIVTHVYSSKGVRRGSWRQEWRWKYVELISCKNEATKYGLI